MNESILDTRCVISIFGNGTEEFLNRILTNNVPEVSDSFSYALLLTPQGKLLYDFFIQKIEDNLYLLDIPSKYKKEIIEKLDLYKLNLDLIIEERDDLCVVVSSEKIHNNSFKDPRFDGCYRAISTEKKKLNLGWYDYLRIKSVTPEHTVDFAPGEFFPFHLSMQKFGALNYQKGCYIGQEVIARTTYRGKIRSAAYLLEFDNNIKDIDNRDVIYQGKQIGKLLSYFEKNGIAVLSIEEAERVLLDGACIEVFSISGRVVKCR